MTLREQFYNETGYTWFYDPIKYAKWLEAKVQKSEVSEEEFADVFRDAVLSTPGWQVVKHLAKEIHSKFIIIHK